MTFRPNKPRDVGSTEAVIEGLYAQAGGPKTVASLIERSVSQTYAYADPQSPEQMTYAQVRKIARFTGATAGAEDLAQLAGGVFVPMNVAPGALGPAAAAAVKEAADVVSVLLAGRDPDSEGGAELTRAELDKLDREIDEALRVLLQAKGAVAVKRGEG